MNVERMSFFLTVSIIYFHTYSFLVFFSVALSSCRCCFVCDADGWPVCACVSVRTTVVGPVFQVVLLNEIMLINNVYILFVKHWKRLFMNARQKA